MSLKKLIVDRYRRPQDFTYTYTAKVGVSAIMDKATADEHPQTEKWMVDTLLDRLISELILLKQNGGEVQLNTHGDER